jgi:hypothetical protein
MQSKRYPKLSKLQKSILVFALQRHRQGQRVYNRELLHYLYGLPTVAPIEELGPGALAFDVQAIGKRRYMAASVSVARSFKRLRERGLMAGYYGVELTPEGKTLARKLRDSSRKNLGSV